MLINKLNTLLVVNSIVIIVTGYIVINYMHVAMQTNSRNIRLNND
jgi:hypothetical protein